MAKLSVIHRNKRREKLVEKYRALRDQLRSDAKDLSLTAEQREAASLKMQKMPRNACPSRRKNRCKLCGRPRAYNRLTGLCRLHMRIATLNGMVPGMRKASW